MSVFTSTSFLFLRDPHGGVEDMAAMQRAGFAGVFCNIGDHPASEWEAIIRPRALGLGMYCGPWLRTADASNAFDEGRLDTLIACADEWGSPLIVNAESELQGSGETLTTLIREKVGDREAAVSMEPWPFDNVAWWPIGDLPMLPQVSADYGWHEPPTETWWAYGVRCVFPTFGTFGKAVPNDYALVAPYSLYTADDCGGDYEWWRPTGSGYVGCQEAPTPIPPDGGDDMATVIGSQDGITASCNRFRDRDPAGTLLAKQANGKWPGIETLTQPLDQWKAYDKLERALSVLATDHDAELGYSGPRDSDDGS